MGWEINLKKSNKFSNCQKTAFCSGKSIPAYFDPRAEPSWHAIASIRIENKTQKKNTEKNPLHLFMRFAKRHKSQAAVNPAHANGAAFLRWNKFPWVDL